MEVTNIIRYNRCAGRSSVTAHLVVQLRTDAFRMSYDSGFNESKLDVIWMMMSTGGLKLKHG